MWRRRGRRVVTPDGYIWFVRRRRARRRPFWSRDRDRGSGSTASRSCRTDVPGVMDMFTYAEDDLGESGFDRSHDDRRAARERPRDHRRGSWSRLAWLTLTYVLPWLVSLVVDNARPILAVVTTLTVLVALNQLHRPWYVVLQRQGLADAPGGVAHAGMAAERPCCASSPPPSAKAASTAVAPRSPAPGPRPLSAQATGMAAWPSPGGRPPRSRRPCRARQSSRTRAGGTPWGRARRPGRWPSAAPPAGRRCSR